MMRFIYLILSVILAFECFSQNEGKVNEAFGQNGTVVTAMKGALSSDNIVIKKLSGDKILLAGNSDSGFYLIKYEKNGQLSTDFGQNGIVKFSNEGFAVLISMNVLNDKIIVYYQAFGKLVLHCFNLNGLVDNSFGVAGRKLTNIIVPTQKLVFQEDGNFIVGGYAGGSPNNDVFLKRFNIEGNIDSTFGFGGVVTLDLAKSNDILYSIAIQPDGKILICGKVRINFQHDFFVARLLKNGSIDTSFGADHSGIVFADYSNQDSWTDIIVLPSGKIGVTGNVNVDSAGKMNMIVSRYLPNGLLDSLFGTNGITQIWFENYTRDVSYKIFAQNNGKLLICGNSAFLFRNNSFAMFRLNEDGNLDSTFGENGKSYLTMSQSEHATGAFITETGIFMTGASENQVTLCNFKLDNATNIKPIHPVFSGFKIYPNPVLNDIKLDFSDYCNGCKINACVYNAMGEPIKCSEYQDKTHEMDVSYLNNGLYFLKVTLRNHEYWYKFIK